MQGAKFLGLCVLLSAILVAGALFFNAISDRYYFFSTNDDTQITFDKLTGNYYYRTMNSTVGRNDILSYRKAHKK